MLNFIFIIIGIAVVGGIIGGVYDLKKNRIRSDKMRLRISNLDGLVVSKEIITQKGDSAFVVDQENRQTVVIKGELHRFVNYEDIISVELIEDGSIMTSKSTLRTIGGALVGGALAGGAGLVVGGLSGSSSTKEKVSKVFIKILTNNMADPSIIIDCFDSRIMTAKRKKEIKKDSLEGHIYRTGLAQAQEIKDLISIIIDDVDNNQSNKTIKIETTDKLSRLNKLSDLKDKGILSENEFNKLKNEILNELK